MLKELDLNQKMNKQAYKTLMDELKPQLVLLQQEVKRLGIPVVILFEGPRAAGKVTALAELILHFDPRGFRVHSTREPEPTDLRMPWLWRFAKKAPARGSITLFDNSWYFGMRLEQSKKRGRNYPGYIRDINAFERQLADDGCLILKYFLFISKKEQKKRLGRLAASKATRWQVTTQDIDYLKNYKRNRELMDGVLQSTDTQWAPWHVIPATCKRYARAAVMQSVAGELKRAIATKEAKEKLFESVPAQRTVFRLLPARGIETYDLGLTVADEEYRREKKKLQTRLRDLHSMLYSKKVPMILCFEGNDAAGKGGNIKRIARALDPRGYAVIPTGAPSPGELSHQYLWRFLHGLPRTGHISIFDRTWYGRVLVERVEGLIPESILPRSYDEINEFEYMLHKWGAVILKFWVAASKDEQLLRFEARQAAPEKQWKITEEDWRNREKWDAYQTAINDMFRHTNTDFAPWTVVESNSKQYARLKTLRAVTEAIEQTL